MQSAADAIAHYHELLARDWRAVRDALLCETSARKISFLGRPVVRSLRPAFIGARAYEDARRGAALVGQAIHQLARQLQSDSATRSALGLGALHEHLVAAEPDAGPMVARLDGFFGDDGTLRFLEYNPIPFGTVFSELVAEIFAAMPIMEAFTRRFRSRHVSTSTLLVQAMERSQAERGRSGRRLPHVAVVLGAAGAIQVAQTEGAHMMQLAARAGAAVRVVSPQAIVRRDGGLWAEDFPIDCLTFGENDEFLSHFPEEHPVWTALRNREVWLFGSLAAMALHGNKCLFAMMSEPENGSLFTPEVREAIQRHVPWTRIVRDTRTDYRGRTVNLLDLVTRERQRFALKPAMDFGGRGVTLGWRSSAAEWESALGEACRRTYVVQERLPNRSEPFPCADGDELRIVDHHVDFNPYIWNGREINGALVRISEADLLNITAGGGSLVAVFILEE